MRSNRWYLAALLTLTASLLPAAAASAETRTETFRYGPVAIGPYQVLQEDLLLGVPKPAQDGHITGMEVDVVDPDGTPVPIDRMMLHHIVFANLGEQLGQRHDGTCNTFTAFDSSTKIPALGERFYAAGEERAELRLPEGYGYPMQAEDRWGMTLMLMNHRARADSAFVEYTVTYETEPRTAVTPYWLDVRNCLSDPVYDVPGGGRPGSTHTESMDWAVPQSGRIVAAGGHVHGGARNLTLNRQGCRLYASRPTWGLRSHPFYNVKPVLHEPGPINMSGFTSASGFPVQRGERLRLDSNYDARRLHTRVMGIMIVFLAPGPAPPTDRCARPDDLVDHGTSEPGRRRAPLFKVPLTGLDRKGRARTISAPRGRRVRVRSGAVIRVGDRFFSKRNVAIPRGGILKWRFASKELHNVTVASGPRGFSSLNLDGGRRFRAKLRKPGTYRIFCALHPVDMVQTVRVERKRRKGARVRGRARRG